MRPSPLIVALLTTSAVARVAYSREEPTLPTPPSQAKPWTPPRSALPRFLSSATADLFEQGLADPRGCEYRHIWIKVGSVWGREAQTAETAGWVLPPADEGGKPRFAVAWSGLVYPLVNVGDPANLDADARSIGGGAPADGPRGFNGFGTNNEAASVAVTSMMPVRICLLLRLGRADLAGHVWEKVTGRHVAPPAQAGDRPKLDLNSYGVSYLSLARDLAWYHFDRAVCAHMRGDDALALADARFLDRFAKAVNARAEAMGFTPGKPGGKASAYIDFLGQLPELLADQERRARERENPPAEPAGRGQEARIAMLIRDLDQVAARQWGQPGGVVLGESPIIKALIDEGDAAVEPLIRDFRTEDRLTRSVSFGRDFFRGRAILRADQAAYTALTGILKTSDFTKKEPGDKVPSRQTVADRIEAYWQKNHAVPLVERWYRTLADDSAGESAWLEAAGNITRPENVKLIRGGGPFVVTETTKLAPGERPKLRGEPLREGHDPTVAALMVRRTESMLRSPEGQGFELRTPRQMAAMLAKWDPEAGLPTLRELTRICRERFARPGNGSDWTVQSLAVSVAQFTLARARAGDAKALPEYAAWVRTTRPEQLGQEALAVLEPLYRKPDDPALADASAWLFGDPESAWVPLIGREGTRPTFETVQLISSSLTDVPAFRSEVLKALRDRSPIGTARTDGRQVNVKLDSGLSVGRSAPRGDQAPPAPGIEAPVRRCDLYAWQLSTLDGAPAFNPCWPETRRDEALSAMTDFLRRKDGR